VVVWEDIILPFYGSNIRQMKNCLKILCLILLVFLATACASQNTTISFYYKNVFEAEDSIVEGNYSAAKELYSRAFSYKEPFAFDLKNAINLELITQGDTAVLIDYCIKYIKSTGDTLFIYNNSQLSLYKFRDVLLNSLLGIKPDFDPELLDYLRSIEHRDQAVRDSCSKIHVDFYHNPACQKEIKIVDSLNQLAVLNILKRKQNLSEACISSEGWHVIWLICLHNGAWGRDEIHRELKKKVFTGEYDTREYVYLVDRFYESDYMKEYRDSLVYNDVIVKYGTNNCIIINNTLFSFKFIKESNLIVNNNRKQVFLESYERFTEKYIWQFQQDIFMFKSTCGYMQVCNETYKNYFNKFYGKDYCTITVKK
jgi:hypothetical protein